MSLTLRRCSKLSTGLQVMKAPRICIAAGVPLSSILFPNRVVYYACIPDIPSTHSSPGAHLHGAPTPPRCLWLRKGHGRLHFPAALLHLVDDLSRPLNVPSHHTIDPSCLLPRSIPRQPQPPGNRGPLFRRPRSDCIPSWSQQAPPRPPLIHIPLRCHPPPRLPRPSRPLPHLPLPPPHTILRVFCVRRRGSSGRGGSLLPA